MADSKASSPAPPTEEPRRIGPRTGRLHVVPPALVELITGEVERKMQADERFARKLRAIADVIGIEPGVELALEEAPGGKLALLTRDGGQ